VTGVHIGGVPAPYQQTLSDALTPMLNNALAGFWLPYPAFPAGAFTPTIAVGPSIAADELTFTGNL
jgi:hypothetical protein